MKRESLAIAMLAGWLAAAGCADDTDVPPGATASPSGLTDPSGTFDHDELEAINKLSPEGEFLPADPTNAVADDPGAARLGQFLYFDTRLSGDGEQSCATCHRPDHGFADPRQLSEAMGTTARHAPTLLNAAFNRWYFWDGRTDSLWAQAIEPLEAPNEQGTTRLDIAHLVAGDAELRAAYEAVFGALPDLSDPDRFPASGRPVPGSPDHPHARAWASMSAEDQRTVDRILTNVTKAIAAYEMQLVSLDAPFDRYVEGLRDGDAEKLSALDEQQKEGLKLFVGRAGCTKCHAGPLMTNFEFHNLGFEPRGWLVPDDLGRWDAVPEVKADPFNAAGAFSDAPDGERARELRFLAQQPENEGQFKTPTLRNVALTPPYMHGGHFETLEEVVRFYAELDESPVLVGHRDETLVELDLSDEEVDALVAFFETLTGAPLPDALTRPPNGPRQPSGH
ncbi:hypothetical protein FIV42_23885 [Persicimonas caeni]|uniref:Cytochrome c domain-containing protein n=1 Tax=Persicimonas caeni TaxID=2292766 RepID=A0A4Y6PZH2_PERCE|nr:cytochrome c peroxidase [Persicimonas caeni]QDG53672.1 hypothetical protein FIV42_23885 [Persicimonas caeni]QED34893.1 hypothetical protein FRD00_23880 [Persicimonas caeni]